MSTYPEGIPKNLIEACSLGKIIVTSNNLVVVLLWKIDKRIFNRTKLRKIGRDS